jgi:serine protease Do
MDDTKNEEIEENEEIEFDFISDDEDEEINLVTEEKEKNKTKRKFRVKSFTKVIAVVLIFALVFGFSIGLGVGFINNKYFANNENIESNSPDINPIIKTDNTIIKNIVLSKEEMNTVEIVDKVAASVVGITSKVKYRDWYNNVRTSEGSGSGVVFKKDDEKIYILTNNHVIDSANELLVEIMANDFQKAEVIGKDSISDIAVIAIENNEKYNGILPVEFADSDLLKPGQKAIALGNPLGYNNTVTVGVISALERDLGDSNPFKLIQTDAAINPGNSGGALLDSQAKLIGINTIKISATSSETIVEGIGFAIPINSIKPILDEILEYGFISRPYLGIYGKEVNQNISDLYEIPMGIFVSQIVENSGAYNSDLKVRDIIISINGVKTSVMKDLTDEITNYKVGDIVSLKVIRNGETKKEIQIELTQRNVN